jgi:hypothetical protein
LLKFQLRKTIGSLGTIIHMIKYTNNAEPPPKKKIIKNSLTQLESNPYRSLKPPQTPANILSLRERYNLRCIIGIVILVPLTFQIPLRYASALLVGTESEKYSVEKLVF